MVSDMGMEVEVVSVQDEGEGDLNRMVVKDLKAIEGDGRKKGEARYYR